MVFNNSFPRYEIYAFFIFSFLSSVTLSKMFVVRNMKPRHVVSCDGKKVLLSECIKNHKRRKIVIALMLPIRNSSYVFPIILRSSMYIVICI